MKLSKYFKLKNQLEIQPFQSSFNTLINQAPIKPDPLQTFEYRVVPGNADASMLIHRMTVDLGGNSGIMPLIVNPDNDYPIHKDKHIQNIKDWINAGAPDLDGNTRTAADFPPQILGVNARNGGILQNRGGKYEPILVDADVNLTLWFSLTDDKSNRITIRIKRSHVSFILVLVLITM